MENITQGQWFRGPSADLGEPINQSLRFQNDTTATYLHNSSLAGHQLADYTVSVWLKRGEHADDGARYILTSGDVTENTGGGNNVNKLAYNHDGSTPGFVFRDAGGNTHSASQPLQRDHSAWYHLVAVRDHMVAGTIKLYVNGTEIGSASATGSPGLFNESGDTHVLIGLYADPQYRGAGWKGYMAEFNFLESKLAPTDFGRTNEDGIWVPKKIDFTSAQYGAKGFRLQFNDASNLGDDSAPTGTGHASANDFTAVGFNTAAISSSNEDNDVSFNDTPTNNYAVLNSLNVFDASVTYKKGNLRANYGAGGNKIVFADMPMNDGKYYWECTCKDQIEGWIGVVTEDYEKRQLSVFSDNTLSWSYNISNASDNQKNHNGSNSLSHGAIAAGDTLGFLLDIPNGTLKLEINGATQSNSTFSNIPTNKNIFVAFNIGGGSGNVNMDLNFGQMAFQHEPTGYQHVATNSLPEPTIKNGKEHFEAITWSGTGSAQNVTGLSFQPDLVWNKLRSQGYHHRIFDSVRGATNSLSADLSNAQATDSSSLSSFNSDGFTWNGTGFSYNSSGQTLVSWCWKAGGAPTTDNTNSAGAAQTAGSVKLDGANSSFAHGTIAAKRMSVNQTAGFSIVRYTGTGSSGSIPHGLGAVPGLIIIKNLTSANNWGVYHSHLTATDPEDHYLNLNATTAAVDDVARFNDTKPTSTVFTIGTKDEHNTSGNDYIAYCWAPVEGYSAFGGYTGNGTSGNGPFIYTGHKSRFLMVKGADISGDWIMLDTARTPNNPNDVAFKANDYTAEFADANNTVDFLSNGFKIRNNGDADLNTANYKYIYMSWAEHPFGGENTPPATAH